jgi:hypothetical protein
MKLHRTKRDKENPFLVINNHCFKNDKLSLKAKGFLCLIFSLPDDWSFSISGISVLVGESKKSVYKIIQELIDNGYCTKSQKKEAGKFCNIEYDFYEIPFNKDNEPFSQNGQTQNGQTQNEETEHIEQNKELYNEPFSQNPLSGFTHSEKGTQLNNNIINNSIEVNIYDYEEENFSNDENFEKKEKAKNFLKTAKPSQINRLRMQHKLSVEHFNEKVDEFVEKKFDWGENSKWKNEDDMAMNFEFWLPSNYKRVVNPYKQWNQEEFKQDCAKHKKTFGKDVLNKFYNHFRQRTETGEMLFQTKAAWNTEAQLKNWYNENLKNKSEIKKEPTKKIRTL